MKTKEKKEKENYIKILKTFGGVHCVQNPIEISSSPFKQELENESLEEEEEEEEGESTLHFNSN